MKNKYGWQFVVEGKGQFPTDMLRYDNCYPVIETEANKMRSHSIESYQVTLRTEKAYITPERWNSFLWVVIQATPLDKAGIPLINKIVEIF